MQKTVVIFIPSIEGGGVEKNLFIIANYLSKKINKIKVITTSISAKKKFNRNIDYVCFSNKIFEKLNRKIKIIFCLYLLFKEIINTKEIVIVSFQANIFAILLAKVFNVEIIVRANSSPIGWSQNILKKKIFKFFYKQANKIIVNSNEFKKDFLDFFNLKTICIYNPLNLKDILKQSKSKKYFIKLNKWKNKHFVILTIGRIVEQKNQLIILKSLEELLKIKIKIKLLIVGEGKLKKYLINYAKNKKLLNNVKFLKFQKNPYPLYKFADIFILSSKFEGLPNVLLEAQALKTPIISSKCKSGPKEILLNGKAGLFFNYNNHSDLAKKIIKYLENKKLSKKHTSLGYKSIYRFDLEKNFNKYFKVIFNP
jgi:glycosyltransferase involved in cell wall biosynthesis